MIYIQYIFLVCTVVVLSLFLSKFVDELDKITNLSGAFIGGVLLAGITSLPEFITSITAVNSLNQPQLVQGNVLGSNIFNATVLGICFLFATQKFNDGRIERNHAYTASITLALYFAYSFFMKAPTTFGNDNFNLQIMSVFIIIGYAINLVIVSKDNGSIGKSTILLSQPVNLIESSKYTLKEVISRMCVLALLLVIASVYLTNVSDELNAILGLGTTIGGAIFLGIATSLPELTASINLVRLNNFNAGVGNVVGSNMFNLIILAFSDIIYHETSLYAYNYEASNLLNFSILSLLFIISTFLFKGFKAIVRFLGIGIISCYVLSVIMSI